MVDAPTGHVTLGANMANGIEQKGIDTCLLYTSDAADE